MKPSDASRQIARRAWWLFAALWLVYNSNGREISSYDSQPTKFAAIELVLDHTLTLDWWVKAAPDFGQRPAFQLDRQGHYRSAYSIVPSIEAAGVAWLLDAAHAVDLRAPLSSALVAVLTASLLTAAAVVLVFLAVARTSGAGIGLVVAIGLGLGTNLWPMASRTLWQLETVSAGLALAMHAWLRPSRALSPGRLILGAAGLTLAGAARPQIAPMIAIVAAGVIVRLGWKRAMPALVFIGASAAALVGCQWHWFGDWLGPTTALQAQNLKAHAVVSTVSSTPWIGALGLLFSPNRGLVVFSPIALFAIGALPALWCREFANGERWWTAAAIAQFAGYACYSMWWGGHTYGPRYLVDILVPLAPAAAAGAAWAGERSWRRALGWAALAVSIAIAATGAFCYPNDRWNNDPDVDLNHARLWDWRDWQVARAWREGPSPQNFSLFTTSGYRQPPGR